MDFHQLWTIVSTPDNVPIVLLLFVVPFYTWYGLRQAFANDRLITQLEADPVMAGKCTSGRTCCASSFWRRSSSP
jgi:hypothetical protein